MAQESTILSSKGEEGICNQKETVDKVEVSTPESLNADDNEKQELESKMDHSPLHTTSPPLPFPSFLSSPPPLPDFMTALNMGPTTTNNNTITPMDTNYKGGVVSDESPLPPPVKVEKDTSIGPGDKDALIESFKQDPSGVLSILQSALSVERLSSLLKEEHRDDSELLSQLQNRLEVAYHTLKECQDNKVELSSKITETNGRIGEKRKHLETLRGELKILGDEELKLKRKRDVSQTKYSELKKKLKCSTDALQQLTQISEISDSNGRAS